MRGGLIYLFLTFSVTLNAQKLSSDLSVKKIFIGESLILTYSATITESDSLIFTPRTDEIQTRKLGAGALSSEGVLFEIVKEFEDTNIIKNKNREWIGNYTVTAWDSGTFIIPGQKIHINDSTYTFDDLIVECSLMDAVDGVDLYDIKENFANIPVKPFSLTEFLKNNWWWLLLITILIITYFAIKRRKQRAPVIEEKIVSLKQRTIIAIEGLENSKLWEKELLKQHFVELSYILRSYLTSRYNISLLEKTTYQTKLLLTQKGLNEDTIEVIIRILSQSDMVKFAKSKPDVVAILQVSTLAKQIVAETSPLEFDNVE